MGEKDKNRDCRVTVRFTEDELKKVQGSAEKTIIKEVAPYIRSVVLGKPVTIKYRNRSLDDFMEEMIRLRKELTALGNNFNQVVKKINSVASPVQRDFWLTHLQAEQKNINEKVGVIKDKIFKFSEQWLTR